MTDGTDHDLLAEQRAMTRDRERLRSDYAAGLIAHFGPRALTIAREQVTRASGGALAEWTALVTMIEAQLEAAGISVAKD